MRLRTPVLSGFLLTVALLGSACSVGTPMVAKADVEKQVNTKLTEVAGEAPDSISCPGDLEGKVGATMRCTLSAGGSTIGLTVTVTDVDGTNVGFDVVVDDSVTSTTAAE